MCRIDVRLFCILLMRVAKIGCTNAQGLSYYLRIIILPYGVLISAHFYIFLMRVAMIAQDIISGIPDMIFFPEDPE